MSARLVSEIVCDWCGRTFIAVCEQTFKDLRRAAGAGGWSRVMARSCDGGVKYDPSGVVQYADLCPACTDAEASV